MSNSLSDFSNLSGKTSPEQRARNRELLDTWKVTQKQQQAESNLVKVVAERRRAFESVVYGFSTEKIPMGAALIKGGIINRDSLPGLIVTLKIDSYYIDCLQTIKRFSDCLLNPILFDEDLLQKLTKIAGELGVEFNSKSFQESNYLVDDFLDALILQKTTNSPNDSTDLYKEFDILLHRYFPSMSSVRLKGAMDDYVDAVFGYKGVDPMLLKGMRSDGRDISGLVTKEINAIDGMRAARSRMQDILIERIASSEV